MSHLGSSNLIVFSLIRMVLILVVMDVALGPSVEHMEGMFAKSVLILVVMDVALGRFLRK